MCLFVCVCVCLCVCVRALTVVRACVRVFMHKCSNLMIRDFGEERMYFYVDKFKNSYINATIKIYLLEYNNR